MVYDILHGRQTGICLPQGKRILSPRFYEPQLGLFFFLQNIL